MPRKPFLTSFESGDYDLSEKIVSALESGDIQTAERLADLSGAANISADGVLSADELASIRTLVTEQRGLGENGGANYRYAFADAAEGVRQMSTANIRHGFENGLIPVIESALPEHLQGLSTPPTRLEAAQLTAYVSSDEGRAAYDAALKAQDHAPLLTRFGSSSCR